MLLWFRSLEPAYAAVQGITAVAWTAIATGVLALLTLLTLLTTVVITAQDRRKASQDLLAERAFAEKLLTRQLRHGEEQLTRQLQHTEEQRLAERSADRDQRQEAAAWQVAVMLSWAPHGSDNKVLLATIYNYSERTIGRLRVRFLADDGMPAGISRAEYVARQPMSTAIVGTDMIVTDMIGTAEVLASGAGMRFTSEPIDGTNLLRNPAVEARWRDYLAQGWQYESTNSQVIKITAAQEKDW